ncbi:hypothetical protein [Paraglaciecola sp.]|uniref:hypothetical protein n=1 Tax=Paraglaciecola sp. TaxID=1920173 RepID=UPI0030F40FBD
MRSFLAFGLMYVVILSSNAIAEQYTITADEMTLSLQTRFPVTRSYEGVEAVFSHPELIIKNLDDEIKIEVKIKVTYQGKSLLADGLIVDTASIQTVDNTLRFDHPKLEEFFVSQDDMPDSAEAIKVIKQTIGQTLPPIVLLDLEKIDLNMVGNEPAKFSLSPLGIVLEY